MCGEDIASLINHCRAMSLTEEEGSIMGKLYVAARTVDVSGFETFFIPLLRVLIERLRNDSFEFTGTAYQTFIQNIIVTYIRRFICQEPARSSNWSQARQGCGCMDCRNLDEFLFHSTQKVGTFPLAQKRRAHIHRQLDGTGCTHETEHCGSPHTLVVTKTENGWRQSRNEWKQRLNTASQKLQELSGGPEVLEGVLGDRHREIVSSETVKIRSAATRDSMGPQLTAPVTTIPTPALPRPPEMSPSYVLGAHRLAKAGKRVPLSGPLKSFSNGGQGVKRKAPAEGGYRPTSKVRDCGLD